VILVIGQEQLGAKHFVQVVLKSCIHEVEELISVIGLNGYRFGHQDKSIADVAFGALHALVIQRCERNHIQQAQETLPNEKQSVVTISAARGIHELHADLEDFINEDVLHIILQGYHGLSKGRFRQFLFRAQLQELGDDIPRVLKLQDHTWESLPFLNIATDVHGSVAHGRSQRRGGIPQLTKLLTEACTMQARQTNAGKTNQPRQ
jgi:hypothetical protein